MRALARAGKVALHCCIPAQNLGCSSIRALLHALLYRHRSPRGGKCSWTVLLDGPGQTPSVAGLCNLHRCLRAPAQHFALQALKQNDPSAWHPSLAAGSESSPRWLLCSHASDAAGQRVTPLQLEILRQMNHFLAGPPLPGPAQYKKVVYWLPIGQPCACKPEAAPFHCAHRLMCPAEYDKCQH